MSNRKILIYARREEPAEVLKSLDATGCEIVFGDNKWVLPGDNEDALVTATRDAVALLGTSIRNTPITRRVLQASQSLRLVSKYTVGVDDIDVDAATEMGILVCHAPTEENCFGVAESTMAMMLSLQKRLREKDAAIRAGRWRDASHGGTYLGKRLSDDYAGITIGIVGLGRIGTRFANLLAPWRVRIIACDPYAEPSRFLLAGVERVDYETLLKQSDVVSFHVVLNKETRYMLSDKQIELMKPTAIVLNTARGGIVEEAALARGILAKKIRAAAIDAFEVEPLPADSPLRNLGDGILMSPHAAAASEAGELLAGVPWAARSVVTALAGRVPDNVYNKEVIPKWLERFGGVSVSG